MNVIVLIAAVTIGYIVGSVSFARIIGRIVIPGEDLDRMEIEIEGAEREFTVRAVSASVIRKKAGSRYGCLTSILDMAKSFIPTLAFYLIFPDEPYYLFAAAAAVFGHNFPIYHRFRGGRGFSPIYGGLFIIDWLAIPVTALVGSIIGGLVFRYVLMSYFGVTILLIPWLWFRFGDWSHLAYAVAVNISFWLASIPEIREYFAHRKTVDLSSGDYLVRPEPGPENRDPTLAERAPSPCPSR